MSEYCENTTVHFKAKEQSNLDGFRAKLEGLCFVGLRT
jgi:hypothetical protein